MEGKVAIVTGGAGGLGSEICRKFAARGAAVAVADMNAEAASELAASIEADGRRAIAVQVEVTDEGSVSSAVQAVVNKLGRVDYLVLMSSVTAMSPVPERGAYGPAKAALINFAGQLGLEWAQFGINVNAVCPGVALTPMTEMVYEREPELREQRLKRFPIKREVLPEEVADLVLFLCSPEARYINGVGIPIDGGFLNSGFYQDSGS